MGIVLAHPDPFNIDSDASFRAQVRRGQPLTATAIGAWGMRGRKTLPPDISLTPAEHAVFDAWGFREADDELTLTGWSPIYRVNLAVLQVLQTYGRGIERHVANDAAEITTAVNRNLGGAP